jgi:hypothetical protein
MLDKQADREAIRLLRKVDKLRRELKILEPQLSKAAVAYGQRRRMSLFNEFHLRNNIELEARQKLNKLMERKSS